MAKFVKKNNTKLAWQRAQVRDFLSNHVLKPILEKYSHHSEKWLR
jgi:hypothetical protein